MEDHMRNVVLPTLAQTFGSWLQTRRINDQVSVSGTCGTQGGVPIPSDMNGKFDGYSYDTLMFATLRPTYTGVLGFAGYCRTEAAYGRPIMGHLNLSPRIFASVGTPNFWGTIYHEVTHALGISSSLYSKYVDENGQLRSNAFQQKTRTFVDSTGTQRSVSYTELTTPALVQKAKEYFNCNQITGVPMEEGGGSGTAGSHFEKLYFYNELMSGSVSFSNPIDGFSNEFTLALLQDSGWYTINTQQVIPAVWGKGLGCNFLGVRCENWNTGNTGYFCTDSSLRLCTFNYRGKGSCQIQTYTSNLGYYEHIPGKPTVGGRDSLIDYCPIVLRSTNCQLESSAPSSAAIWGETYSTNSGCFDSNVIDNGYVRDAQSSRCLSYTCENGILHINIKHKTGVTTVDCPADESVLKVEPSIPGFSGYVTCPKHGYRTLCGIKKCFGITGDDPTVCSGHGRCVGDDQCSCTGGYSGTQCTTPPPTCYSIVSTDPQVCGGHGVCQAKDTCVCNQGYIGAQCTTATCFNIVSNDASVCSGHGTCVSADNCTCISTYSGPQCNIPKCFGIAADAVNSCSGHGNCTVPNMCSCSNGFSGSDCSVPPIPPTVQFVNYPNNVLIPLSNITITASVSGYSESYQWRINGQIQEGASSDSMLIPSTRLQRGQKYIIRLEHANPGGVGYAQVELTVNELPRPGTMVVSPSQGQSLLTEFSFTSNGWSDKEGSALLYRWTITDASSNEVYSVIDTTSTSLKSKGLPAGKNSTNNQLIVTLEVFDSLMESSSATRTIVVKPISLTDSSSQVQSILNTAGMIDNVAQAHQTVLITKTLSSMIKSSGSFYEYASQLSDIVSDIVTRFKSVANTQFIDGMSSSAQAIMDSIMNSSLSKEEMQQKIASILMDLLDIVSENRDSISMSESSANAMMSTVTNILEENDAILPQVSSIVQRIGHLYSLSAKTYPFRLSNEKFDVIASPLLSTSGSSLILNDNAPVSATFSPSSITRINQLDTQAQVIAQITVWRDSAQNPQVYEPFLNQTSALFFSNLVTVSFTSQSGQEIRVRGLGGEEAITLRFQLDPAIDTKKYEPVLYYQQNFGEHFQKDGTAKVSFTSNNVVQVRVTHNTNYVVGLVKANDGLPLVIIIPTVVGAFVLLVLLVALACAIVLVAYCCVKRRRQAKQGATRGGSPSHTELVDTRRHNWA